MAGAANFFVLSLLLVATTVSSLQQVQGGLHVDAEDISKTIKSKNGVVIDCVYIDKQPTLKHPLFKDHKVQVYKDSAATARPIGRRLGGFVDGTRAPPVMQVEQEWRRSGSCPVGTVPILRLPKTAATNLTVIPSLSPSGLPHRDNAMLDDSTNSPRNEFAVAYGLDGPYHGASAFLPSWRPTKIEPQELSATSLLIAATVDRDWISDHPRGTFPPDTTNQIAVGLAASEYTFGNGDPNLYVYYTTDDGKSFCVNLDCPGFVQTSNEIALGTSFINGGSSKTYDGVPYVSVSIHIVPGQQQWWVTVNDTAIGYFPQLLFPTSFPESFLNQVGGIVHDTRPNGVHTDTVMGNGRLPDDGGAAVVKAYLTVAADGTYKKDMPVKFGVTAPKCYNAAVLGENLDLPGYDIAYGGPGGSGCDM
ncbi:unnamed protein product [Urochloa decumbens]|uniref:Neprosin PEP catalytic domain-containing protein n=1 Tax=Urochloa decumbens TaxID=240449 RepID=A0ABC8YPK7_9POAL